MNKESPTLESLVKTNIEFANSINNVNEILNEAKSPEEFREKVKEAITHIDGMIIKDMVGKSKYLKDKGCLE
jgi:hypothetical protein